MKIVTMLMLSLLWGHVAIAGSADTATYMRAAQSSIEQQDWGQAETHLLKVIKSDFNHADARYLLGKIAEERGELRVAKKRYKMALFVDKKHLLALKRWARIAEQLNDDDLLVAYKRLLKREPDRVLWPVKVARIYMKNGSINTERYLKRALKISPNYRPALELMVEYHKKYAIAAHAKAFQKRLDAFPAASVQQKKPVVFSMQRSVEDSAPTQSVQKALVQKEAPAIDQQQQLVEHYMNAARQSMQKQDWMMAEVYLSKVIKRDFKHVTARYLMAKAAEERGELRLAKKRYKMVIFIDKKHLLALAAWGRVSAKLDSVDELTAYQRAMRLEPENALWHLNVAQYYMKHQPLKAKRFLKNVLKMEPNNRQALQLMIRYHQKYTLIARTQIYQRRLDELDSFRRPTAQQKEAVLVSNTKHIKPSVQASVQSSIQSSVQPVTQSVIQPADLDILNASTRFARSKLWAQHLTLSAATLQQADITEPEQRGGDEQPTVSRVIPNLTQTVDVVRKTVLPQSSQKSVADGAKAVALSKPLALSKISVVDVAEKQLGQSDVATFHHYKEAVKQGDSHDQFMLALMYREGRGVAKNERHALSLLQQAARQGLVKAQLTLGLMLYEGGEIQKREMAAIQWFRRAANQGVVDAQYALGLIYASNKRFKNERKAVKWWKAAALQNHAKAQHNLAVMYLHGRGVAKNRTEAMRWFQQEAAHGNPETQFNTDQLYSQDQHDAIGQIELQD